MVFVNYDAFRAVAKFAGIFGIFQSLVWIAFAITGLVAFHCSMDFSRQTNTLGSLLTLTFFYQYFEGTCGQTNIPFIDMTAVRGLNLLSPGDLQAWLWVYLMLHFFWGISSLTLLTNARKKYVWYINVFLYIWVAFIVVVCVLDFALGIQFAVDYDTIKRALHERPYTASTPADQVLISAATVSGIMMVMAFRGWIFWIINVGLAAYLFTQTFKIYDYNQLRGKRVFINEAFVGDNKDVRRSPIDAYVIEPRQPISQEQIRQPYNQPTSIHRLESIEEQPREIVNDRQSWPDNPRPHPHTSVMRSFEPLARQHSASDSDELRPIPQKPIPPAPSAKHININTVVRRDVAAAKVAQELNYRNSFNYTNGASNGLRPVGAARMSRNDDDSPPVLRDNPFANRPPLRPVLRSTRFD
ncbi:uncharacterized protein LOC129766865 [Toxorhynchites rutilus septentrionalis]|uniref:uncharacterized protein LOC129766865 n=1 Tax=Toxorhynchites rutilus septentrionalis TaxID=329112 RepID=UPI00247AF39D|nr:uncharacterized protein LOC129766865 [Toxorhynchites rutilus septentrionalis]